MRVWWTGKIERNPLSARYDLLLAALRALRYCEHDVEKLARRMNDAERK